MESAKSAARQLKPLYKPGMQLLDAGCGAGHYLPSLRQALGTDLLYHGMDYTAYYVELARKAFGNESMFSQGDVRNMPFANNSFDIVMCNNVVYHLPPSLEVPLRELLRVSAHYVLVRLIVGKRNYVIREILDAEDMEGVSLTETYVPNLEDTHFRYFNQYTEAYIRQCVQAIAPDVEIRLWPDRDFAEFNNEESHGMPTGTYTLGNMQLSGSLLLDYHWLLLTK